MPDIKNSKPNYYDMKKEKRFLAGFICNKKFLRNNIEIINHEY